MDPSYLLSVFLAGVSSLMVLGDIFFAHLGPFSTNLHSLKAIAYLITSSSWIKHHVTELKWSQNGFFDVVMTSLYLNSQNI